MRHALFPILALIALVGCKVGPNYTPPAVPLPQEFVEAKTEEMEIVTDADLVHWWTETFHDPFLDWLLEETLAKNYDYLIAWEKVMQARSQYWIQFTQILPEFDLTAEATRFRESRAFARAEAGSLNPANIPVPTPLNIPSRNLSPVQSFYQFGLDALWEVDLWGRLRRSADSAYDLWEATVEDSRSVKITVVSEVSRIYTAIRAYQKKVDIAFKIIELDEETLSLSQTRFQAGLANEQEVESFRATLAGDQAALKVYQTVLKQNIYSLSVLLGELPECIVEHFSVEGPIPVASGKVPGGLPSTLLRRRPDIRSAERRLASATEEIGVAIADLFPKLSLIGSSSSFAANPLQGANIGFTSDQFSKMFTSRSFIWGIGGFVQWPVLDFGRRWAAVDVQTSLQYQAYLTYQKTVMTALQETEQDLVAYFNEEERLRNLTISENSFKKSYELVLDQFHSGLIDYTRVLQARDYWLGALNSVVDSQQALTTDLIAVYKALGGDW